MVPVWLSAYCVLQAASLIAFKHGSDHAARYWACFAVGNVLCIASMGPLMEVMKRLQVNHASALCSGAGMLLGQLTLAMWFHQRLTLLQWLGIVAIVGGIVLVSLGAAAPVPAAPLAQERP